MKFFGLEIKRSKKDSDPGDLSDRKSFVAPDENDGSAIVSTSSYYAHTIDLDIAASQTDKELIRQYRAASMIAECDEAIEDIVNEAIVSDAASSPVTLIMDDLDYKENVKKKILEEFDYVLRLLKFNTHAHEIFRRWYIDGRLYYHKIIDESDKKLGLVECRPIDPMQMTKVREITETPEATDSFNSLVTVIDRVDEYFIYQKLIDYNSAISSPTMGLRINNDAIAYVPSGLYDRSRNIVLSYLFKALKPLNQLSKLEASLIIYRLARAPERRLFYVDVGNLSRTKAEEYLNSIKAKYRNKLVYNAETGEVVDDRKHMSMLEDYWLPRREGGRGTEISTLPGGENLGQIDDILFFQKKLYKALSVPVSRFDSESQFSIGRTTEITRDEVKFQKFIGRLRNKFSELFYDVLKTQLLLKGIVDEDEWEVIRENTRVDFLCDNHFSELVNLDIMRERFSALNDVSEYVGSYISEEYVKKQILNQTDEEIAEITKQNKASIEAGTIVPLPQGEEVYDDQMSGSSDQESGDNDDDENSL